MLPSVSKKLTEMSTGKQKKFKQKKSKEDKSAKKKSKKSKNKKSKKSKRSSSSSSSRSDSSSSSTSSPDHKKKSKKRNYSSDSSQDEWVEKLDTSVKTDENETMSKPLVRDDWMSGILIPTYSKLDEPKKADEKKTLDSYDPTKSSRELNPHWKNGGSGLPTFLKPDSDDESNFNKRRIEISQKPRGHTSGNWKKRIESTKGQDRSKSKSPYRRRSRSRSKDRQHSKSRDKERSAYRPRRRSRSQERRKSRSPERQRSRSKEKRNRRSQEKQESKSRYKRNSRSPSVDDPKDSNLDSVSTERSDFLTDQQMNELGARLIKAEIMGNDELASTLKEKLEKARLFRSSYKAEQLSKITASKSSTDRANKKDAEKDEVLLTTTNSKGVSRPVQKYAKESDLWGGRAGRKTKKVETHVDGERLRFFADDDKYDLKRMVFFFSFFLPT